MSKPQGQNAEGNLPKDKAPFSAYKQELYDPDRRLGRSIESVLTPTKQLLQQVRAETLFQDLMEVCPSGVKPYHRNAVKAKANMLVV